MRLIDADVLLKHLTNCIGTTKGMFRSVCVAIKCFVEQMPTVDAVILPCKIGDTLYDIYEAVNNGGDSIQEYRVKELRFQIDKRGRVSMTVDGVLIMLDDFNKTVFLTREEAETALTKMGGEKDG